jgi:sugar phosphate isomerase/epimerase
MYSLSTCWNSHRHTDGREMLREIRDLGFDFAELSHGIRISLMPGIFDAVDAGEIKISSVHNFCPLPMGVNQAAPNVFKFTTSDRWERDNAIKHTLKTIETATRVRAGAVVLHLGRVTMRDYTEKLLEMAGRGEVNSPRYEKLLAEALEKRESRKEKYTERADELLKQFIEAAAKAGVRLGIENRDAIEEIPFEGELPFWLRGFPAETVGYWHDTGHAQIKEHLGLILHRFHLENLADRLIGLHIHDVMPPGRDHQEPGTGSVDFAALAPYLRPDLIKVFEFSPSISSEAVRRGVVHVKNLWGSE